MRVAGCGAVCRDVRLAVIGWDRQGRQPTRSTQTPTPHPSLHRTTPLPPDMDTHPIPTFDTPVKKEEIPRHPPRPTTPRPGATPVVQLDRVEKWRLEAARKKAMRVKNNSISKPKGKFITLPYERARVIANTLLGTAAKTGANDSQNACCMVAAADYDNFSLAAMRPLARSRQMNKILIEKISDLKKAVTQKENKLAEANSCKRQLYARIAELENHLSQASDMLDQPVHLLQQQTERMKLTEQEDMVGADKAERPANSWRWGGKQEQKEQMSPGEYFEYEIADSGLIKCSPKVEK